MSIGLAARLGDPVGAHSGIGSGGRILMSALKYAAIGAVAAALVVAAVAAAPAIIAGVTAGAAIGAVGAAAGGAVIASVSTFGGALMAGSAVLGVGLSGAAQGIAKQREEESHSHTMGGGCSSINVGSENVIIEGKPAARAKQDTNVHTSPITLKQGSATVFVNGKPLARVGDASDCGGKVIAGASRTYIGGPPSEGGGGGARSAGGGGGGLDDTDWDAWQQGLGLAGLAIGVFTIGGMLRSVVGAAGGLRAALTTTQGLTKLGIFGAQVGVGYAGGEALSAGGGAIGGVTGAVLGEAAANAIPAHKVGEALSGAQAGVKTAANRVTDFFRARREAPVKLDNGMEVLHPNDPRGANARDITPQPGGNAPALPGPRRALPAPKKANEALPDDAHPTPGESPPAGDRPGQKKNDVLPEDWDAPPKGKAPPRQTIPDNWDAPTGRPTAGAPPAPAPTCPSCSSGGGSAHAARVESLRARRERVRDELSKSRTPQTFRQELSLQRSVAAAEAKARAAGWAPKENKVTHIDLTENYADGPRITTHEPTKHRPAGWTVMNVHGAPDGFEARARLPMFGGTGQSRNPSVDEIAALIHKANPDGPIILESCSSGRPSLMFENPVAQQLADHPLLRGRTIVAPTRPIGGVEYMGGKEGRWFEFNAGGKWFKETRAEYDARIDKMLFGDGGFDPPAPAGAGQQPQMSQQQQARPAVSDAARAQQAQWMAEQRARQDALRQGAQPQQAQQQQQQQAGPLDNVPDWGLAPMDGTPAKAQAQPAAPPARELSLAPEWQPPPRVDTALEAPGAARTPAAAPEWSLEPAAPRAARTEPDFWNAKDPNEYKRTIPGPGGENYIVKGQKVTEYEVMNPDGSTRMVKAEPGELVLDGFSVIPEHTGNTLARDVGTGPLRRGLRPLMNEAKADGYTKLTVRYMRSTHDEQGNLTSAKGRGFHTQTFDLKFRGAEPAPAPAADCPSCSGGSAAASQVASAASHGLAPSPPRQMQNPVQQQQARDMRGPRQSPRTPPPGFGNTPRKTLDPTQTPVFRGGTSLTIKANEVRVVEGKVMPSHGISLNTKAAGLERFGGAKQIKSLPSGLEIIQRGGNPNHYEIVPKEPMPLDQFQALLNRVEFK